MEMRESSGLSWVPAIQSVNRACKVGESPGEHNFCLSSANGPISHTMPLLRPPVVHQHRPSNQGTIITPLEISCTAWLGCKAFFNDFSPRTRRSQRTATLTHAAVKLSAFNMNHSASINVWQVHFLICWHQFGLVHLSHSDQRDYAKWGMVILWLNKLASLHVLWT